MSPGWPLLGPLLSPLGVPGPRGSGQNSSMSWHCHLGLLGMVAAQIRPTPKSHWVLACSHLHNSPQLANPPSELYRKRIPARLGEGSISRMSAVPTRSIRPAWSNFAVTSSSSGESSCHRAPQKSRRTFAS